MPSKTIENMSLEEITVKKKSLQTNLNKNRIPEDKKPEAIVKVKRLEQAMR
jgi:hypothetical protein